MKQQTENKTYSFESWLFSKRQWAEKTIGLVVLIVEVFNLTVEIFHIEKYADRPVITHFLNFSFLIIIYIFLRNDFNNKFSVDTNDPKIIELLSLPNKDGENGKVSEQTKSKISELIFHSNTFLFQLRNFNYFLLSTALLYVFLIWFSLIESQIEKREIDLFHYSFNFLSYMAAFFLLRCFYVMYLPTTDENGNDKLNDRTIGYFLLLLFLMFLDGFWVNGAHPENGRFFSELICGILTSVAFILLVARFENKILDIPPIILSILYIYAILQVCLPFITGNGKLNLNQDPELNKEIVDKFKFIVLTLCLVGKVTLASVFLYVLSTNRIFYYFMKLKIIHEEEEEEKNWKAFAPKIKKFSIEPERFSIIYDISKSSKNSKVFTYTARIPNLIKQIDEIRGKGKTAEEAKQNLLAKLTSKNNLPAKSKDDSRKTKKMKLLKNKRLPAKLLSQEDVPPKNFQPETEAKQQNREAILSLAGSWSEMSETDFEEYLSEAKRSGGEMFNRDVKL